MQRWALVGALGGGEGILEPALGTQWAGLAWKFQAGLARLQQPATRERGWDGTAIGKKMWASASR